MPDLESLITVATQSSVIALPEGFSSLWFFEQMIELTPNQ